MDVFRLDNFDFNVFELPYQFMVVFGKSKLYFALKKQ